MSDLDDIISGKPETEEPVTEPQQEEAEAEQQTTEEPEAEKAQPEEAQQEEPEKAEPDGKDEPTVPLAVFKSMRDDLKQQLDQFRQQMGQQPKPEQKAPEPPDMFEDPKGYQQFMHQQMQREVMNARADMSQAMAEREFGKEAVEEALGAAQANPAVVRQFMASPHPYGELMKWHQSQKVAQEIGPDPTAYRQKLEQEIRQKIEAEMAAKQAHEMANKKAPSLAGTNGTGGNTDPGWQGPTDLNALIGE